MFLFLLLLLMSLHITLSEVQCMESAFSNDLLGRNDWVSTNLTFRWGDPKDYAMTRFLGAGTYGDVYGGFRLGLGKPASPVVFKVFSNEPTARRMRKFMKEISILKDTCGHPNLVKLVDILPFNGTRNVPVVVLEKIPGHYLNMALYNQLTDRDNQFYLYELLKAIRFLHDERGIIHRDIKPKNVMVDHETRTLKLLDFGISKYYQKGHAYNTHCGTKAYKPPELLVALKTFDTRLDIWQFGTIMAEFVFRRAPFFAFRKTDYQQLVSIIKVLGTDGFTRFAHAQQLQFVHPNITSLPSYPRTHWATFVSDKNRAFASPAALDLLDRTLRYDYSDRITAAEALQHEYFAEIRREQAL